MSLGEQGEGVDMADMFLKPALICAILSPSGAKKEALMSTLYKDERSKNFSPHFEILERFYTSHIFKWEELATFEKEFL